MTINKKLLEKFKSIPKDLTWDELVKILAYLGYLEISHKGKTAGSRRKFHNDKNDVITLHKPHPKSIVKQYVIKQLLSKLKP